MQTLGECYKNKLVKYYTNEDNLEKEITNLDEIKNSSEKIFINVEIGNELSTGCILNTKSKKYYNYFPFFYEAIYKLKSDKDFYLGTGTTINPFIYGDGTIYKPWSLIIEIKYFGLFGKNYQMAYFLMNL